jgi:hypothetical protein
VAWPLVVEEAACLAEQHRDDMDLEFVEHAGATDQHVLVARGLLGLGHRGPGVAHVRNQWPLPRLAVGDGGG